MINNVFLLLSGILFINGYQQCIAQYKIVCWSSEKRLKWEYYLGKPPEDGSYKGFGAVTHIKKSVEIQWIDGLPYIKVKNIMLQNKSWKRDTSIGLLEHEQLHFDISELYARKIRYLGDSLRNKHIKDIEIYRSEKNKLLDDEDKANRIYDEESCFSICEANQKLWKEKIAIELEKLKKYASKYEDCEYMLDE